MDNFSKEYIFKIPKKDCITTRDKMAGLKIQIFHCSVIYNYVILYITVEVAQEHELSALLFTGIITDEIYIIFGNDHC